MYTVRFGATIAIYIPCRDVKLRRVSYLETDVQFYLPEVGKFWNVFCGGCFLPYNMLQLVCVSDFVQARGCL